MWLALAFKTFCSSENDGDDSDKDDTDIDNDDNDDDDHSDKDNTDDDFAVKEKSIFKEEKLSLPKKNEKRPLLLPRLKTKFFGHRLSRCFSPLRSLLIKLI